MPLYSFDLPPAEQPWTRDLPDDHAAWSEAVTALGELLQDIDGALPRTADWTLRITEGDREVAHIELRARLHGHKEPAQDRTAERAEP